MATNEAEEVIPKCKHKARTCPCGVCVKCPRPSDPQKTEECLIEHPTTSRSKGGQRGKRLKDDPQFVPRNAPRRAAAPQESLNLDAKADAALKAEFEKLKGDLYCKPASDSESESESEGPGMYKTLVDEYVENQDANKPQVNEVIDLSNQV